MTNKQSLVLASSSVLAAGMAHGAINYSGPVSYELTGNSAYSLDLDQDSTIDYTVRFDGLGSGNQLKPFIDSRSTNPNAWVLSKANGGAPVLLFGTNINAGYVATFPTNKVGCLYQQYENNTVVGDWSSTADTDAYVGLAMSDGTVTNYGWAHLIYKAASSSKSLVVVDYAYETEANKPIIAGCAYTPAEPIIYYPPLSQTVGGGTVVTMHVKALADPEPTYQWQAGTVGSGVYANLPENSHFIGTTTPTLTINGATLADGLDYVVVVSNTLGAASNTPPAQLTVVQVILAGPKPPQEEVFVGQTGRFGVEVLSGTPTGFQWRKGGVNLTDGVKYTGVGTANLLINNLTVADNGNYDVVVSTAVSPTTSPSASLTVVATNGGTFESSMLALAPKIYYRLNETSDPATNGAIAFDNTGAINGLYGNMVWNGNATYNVAGPQPVDGFPGFRSTNTAAQMFFNDTNAVIHTAPWNLNTNTVTITAWINPQGVQAGGAAVVYTRSTNLMVCGMSYNGAFLSPNSSLGYNWNDNEGAFFWDSHLDVPADKWSFVALVVTPTNAIIYSFHDQIVSAATNVMEHAVQSFSDSVYIGTDPGSTTGGRNFNGKIDEVAVFTKSLTMSQLTAIYTNATGIAFPVENVEINVQPVSGGLQLQWQAGTLLEADYVTGPWTTNNAPSPYLVVPTGPQKFYRVIVQ